MVKSRRIIPALGAMLRAPWLLFHFLTILALLCSVISASSRNKISDVAGEEGTIDELEALLDHHAGLSHRAGTSVADASPLDDIAKSGASAGANRDNVPSASLKDNSEAQAEKAEKIQFGVAPSDPRYFDQSRPSDLRPYNLQARSDGSLRSAFRSRQDPDFYGGSPADLPRSDPLRLRGGYAGPYANSRISDPQLTGADQSFVDTDLQFAGANQRFDVADPQQMDAYDQFLGDLPDQYDSAFSDLMASRMAGYDQQADPRSEAFVNRLRDVLRSGDRDAAERMLGVQDRQNALGLGDLRHMKATSQPEFVHFNHQQQPHNRQVQPFSSDSASKIAPASQTNGISADLKGDYNPNDPSSNVKSEPKANNSEAALGGLQVAGLPQHLSQSAHSASASQAVVQDASDQGGFSDVYFTAMVAGCTAAAVCFIIGTGVCWYRLNKNQRAAKDTEYPAYGVTGPSRELSPGTGPGGDRNLAHSAHMYHYQQQKNQMIALEKSGGGDGPTGGGGASDVDSEEDDDGEERDYTVYECPGLAPMGEMVVPNPMYPPEDVTPASPSLKEELPGRTDRD